MDNKFFIGIDTSNYTTSVAAISCNGDVVSLKKVLNVENGEKGLRQSQALFFHIQNLPQLIDQLFKKIESSDVAGIGVSVRPRNVEGSYMPCFLAGKSIAYSLASTIKVPVFEFSHQEGHIEAAIHGLCSDERKCFNSLNAFYTFHLSGGTNELLFVKKTPSGYICDIKSSSADITLGQLIDRCGVKLGLKFPCGEEMDELANKSDKLFKIKIAKKDNKINLSGYENKFIEMINNGSSRTNSAKMIFDVVYEAINVMLENTCDMPILFAGGVMRSKNISSRLKNNSNYFFTSPEFSSDNAVGIASLCRKVYI